MHVCYLRLLSPVRALTASDICTSLSGARWAFRDLSPLNFERGGSLEVVRWALVVGACYYRAGAWRPTKQAIDSV